VINVMSSARRIVWLLLFRDGEQGSGHLGGDIEFGGLSGLPRSGRLLCQQSRSFGVLRESALDLEPRGIKLQ